MLLKFKSEIRSGFDAVAIFLNVVRRATGARRR